MLFSSRSSQLSSAVAAPPFVGPLISLRGLEKAFDSAGGRLYVLRRITLDIQAPVSPRC
jgi:hypothetical protein